MKPYGKVECKKALDVKTSRLGIGFEKLDRDAFEPEKAYDKLGQNRAGRKQRRKKVCTISHGSTLWLTI